MPVKVLSARFFKFNPIHLTNLDVLKSPDLFYRFDSRLGKKKTKRISAMLAVIHVKCMSSLDAGSSRESLF